MAVVGVVVLRRDQANLIHDLAVMGLTLDGDRVVSTPVGTPAEVESALAAIDDSRTGVDAGEAPIPMILTCPSCCGRHVDRGRFATHAHHTHACQHCGMVWRPAIQATVGVQFLPGFKDPPESICGGE